jgi:putative CocE/NonD family hydrolase
MRVSRSVALVAVVAAYVAAPAAAAPPPKLPDPTYQSVSQEVLIPMDDGVKLAATVDYPSRDGKTPAPGRFPVVVQMTPYGRNGVSGAFPSDTFATRGIVGAVVDVRGTGGSGGDLSGNYFSPREQRDAGETVEYFGTRPYSTGKVGMTGGSYVGITQLEAAEQQPPHLAAITPVVPISDLYRDGFAHGGIENLFFDLQYIGVQGGPGAAGVNTDPALLQATIANKAGQSPPGMIAFDYLARPNDDAFYRDRSPIYRADRIRVPTLILGGWHDGLMRGSIEMYSALARRPGVETRLYMDPCTHKGCGAPFDPFTDPPNLADQSAVIFEFLDKYLRGTQTPERSPVTYYLQHRDEYRTADAWPPAGTTYERLPLGAGSLGAPATTDATAQYVADPAAGLSMAFDDYGTVAASPYLPTDQRLEGPHGLTFRTAPFTTPRDLVGPLALHLEAASSASDTDWYAKLADVAPDGSESIITEGALRASHRALDPAKSRPERPYHDETDPQPIEPGRFYDYDIEIWPTAYELAPGHRLQLRLTSTDAPTHLDGTVVVDRDHPEATQIDPFPPATETVRYRGSYLLAPIQGPVPAASAPRKPRHARSCSARTRARHVRLRRRRTTVVRATLTRHRHAVRGALVRLRGLGLSRHARTDRHGRVRLVVRARRTGRATVSAALCGARLTVRPGAQAES